MTIEEIFCDAAKFGVSELTETEKNKLKEIDETLIPWMAEDADYPELIGFFTRYSQRILESAQELKESIEKKEHETENAKFSALNRVFLMHLSGFYLTFKLMMAQELTIGEEKGKIDNLVKRNLICLSYFYEKELEQLKKINS